MRSTTLLRRVNASTTLISGVRAATVVSKSPSLTLVSTLVPVIVGVDGADGNTVLYGSGAPDNALGANGNFYINVDAPKTLYGPKAAGVWPAGVSLKGDTGDAGADGDDGVDGDDGNTVLYGSGAPDNALGVNGNFYINVDTPKTLYGPKAAGVWPAGVSLKGDTGDAGADGVLPQRKFESAGNYQYVAVSPVGTAEGDSSWDIDRLTYVAGAYSVTESASGVSWTGRAGHTYS